jgi:hypothetical protein
VSRRRFKRRLFWTAVIIALLLIYVIALVIRAARATAWAARLAVLRVSGANASLTPSGRLPS